MSCFLCTQRAYRSFPSQHQFLTLPPFFTAFFHGPSLSSFIFFYFFPTSPSPFPVPSPPFSFPPPYLPHFSLPSLPTSFSLPYPTFSLPLPPFPSPTLPSSNHPFPSPSPFLLLTPPSLPPSPYVSPLFSLFQSSYLMPRFSPISQSSEI